MQILRNGAVSVDFDEQLNRIADANGEVTARQIEERNVRLFACLFHKDCGNSELHFVFY